MAVAESIRRFEATSAVTGQSFEVARQALFSAAARVISYHTAAMDAKIAQMNRESVASRDVKPMGAANLTA